MLPLVTDRRTPLSGRAAARDAGLRRVRVANRALAVGAVALAIGFSAVAAAALPGSSRGSHVARGPIAEAPRAAGVRGPMAPDPSAQGSTPPDAQAAAPPAQAPVAPSVPPPVTAPS